MEHSEYHQIFNHHRMKLRLVKLLINNKHVNLFIQKKVIKVVDQMK